MDKTLLHFGLDLLLKLYRTVCERWACPNSLAACALYCYREIAERLEGECFREVLWIMKDLKRAE